MSLRELFSRNRRPQRIRICVECGMPIAEHRDWCSILRTQRELDQKGPPDHRITAPEGSHNLR